MDFINRDTLTRYSFISLLTFGFFLPYFIIVIFYILIIHELGPRMMKKKFGEDFRKTNRSKQIRQDVAATRAATLIIVAFMLAWTPYAIICTYGQFGVEIEHIIKPHSITLASAFAKASSIFNPALYILSNKRCKNYFYKKILFFFRRRSELNSNKYSTSNVERIRLEKQYYALSIEMSKRQVISRRAT